MRTETWRSKVRTSPIWLRTKLGRSISREWDQARPSFVKMPVERKGRVSGWFDWRGCGMSVSGRRDEVTSNSPHLATKTKRLGKNKKPQPQL